MIRSNLRLSINDEDSKNNVKSNKEGLQFCSINNPIQSQLHKQILFMQEKYQKIKKKLYQKKLMGELNKQDVQEIGNIMNIIAMKYSQQNKHSIAEEWLRRAFKYCEISERVRIVTYNNLACVYKQSNDLPMAFYYISKAQKQADYFCIQMQDDKLLKVVTDCSLNLCAILSAMGQHYKALKAARKALGLLKSAQSLPGSYYKNLFPILKYNEAVELQRLKMYQQAQFAYMEVKQAKGTTEQLLERVKKALQQIQLLKQGLSKNKNWILSSKISKISRKTKLSLPKFCSSPALQFYQTAAPERNYKSVKTQILIKRRKERASQNEQSYNKRQFRSIQPKTKKQRKLFYQNYPINKDTNNIKTTIKIHKNVLQSVQNF